MEYIGALQIPIIITFVVALTFVLHNNMRGGSSGAYCAKTARKNGSEHCFSPFCCPAEACSVVHVRPG